MTETETSAGIITYRNGEDGVEFLILYSRTKDWEFPKGHVEPDEELQQAALRECKEETSLQDVKILNGFQEPYHYEYEYGGTHYDKTVHMFIAKAYPPTNVQLSKEHYNYKWAKPEEVYQHLRYEGMTEVFTKAVEHLREIGEMD